MNDIERGVHDGSVNHSLRATKVYNDETKFEPWIQTVQGHKFHFLTDDTDEVDIRDIAVALSRMPRWAGHTSEFFSVAQHCVEVAEEIKRRGGGKPQQLLGLLHDATEAYMCDIPKPLKNLLPGFSEIEKKVLAKITKAFFGHPVEIDELVHECDGAMLATEARDLFPFDPIDNWVSRCPPPLDIKIVPVPEFQAYRMFMEKYWELEI